MLDSIKPGSIVGDRYEIGQLLGRGGMGVVFKAFDLNLKRSVALKMIRPDYADQPDFARRFATEAQASAKLDHPNILRIYDFYQKDGCYFMISPFIEGETLLARMWRLRNSEQGMAVGEIIRVAVDVCDGLAHAHSNNVIHRDIKPGNLILRDNGLTVIMDFGVAKIVGAPTQTAIGGILGTPQYMSPEQAAGKTIDARSDLYSLGVILFEMATRRRPFEGDSSLAVLQKQINEPPPKVTEFNPTLPTQLVELIERTLAKSADQRFQSAKEMADSLRSICLDETETIPVIADERGTTIVSPLPLPEPVVPRDTNEKLRIIRYDFADQQRSLRLLVDDFLEPFQREQTERAVGRDFIKLFKRSLEEAQSSLDDDFSLVVIGDFKRGKSTLINALLKSAVVTTDLLPETLTFNQISYGETPRIEAHLPDGGRVLLESKDLKATRLNKVLSSLPQKPTHLSIETPNQWLHGVQLVDTPGLGDLFGSFDPAVLSYLQHADAVVYVISALTPLAASERAFLEFSLRPYEFSKICFVVNFVDSLPSSEEARQVIELIRNRLSALFPNAQLFGVSALTEYRRVIGDPGLDHARVGELNSAFDTFRTHLSDAVIANSQAIQLDRAGGRLALVLRNCLDDLEKLQSTMNADRAQLEAAIAQCEDQNSELRQQITLHQERVFQGIVDMGEEAVGWMNDFVERLRTESISALSNCKYDDVQRYFTFFLSDSLRSALLQCLDVHHARIVEYLRLDPGTLQDISQLVARSPSPNTVGRLSSQIGFTPNGWGFMDNVQLLYSSFGGVLGNALLGLINKRVGDVQGITRYQKHLLQSLPDLKTSVAVEIRRHYLQSAQQFSAQLETTYAQQIAAALSTLQQARELYGLEKESFENARHVLKEIADHLELAQRNLNDFRERWQGKENVRLAKYLAEPDNPSSPLT